MKKNFPDIRTILTRDAPERKITEYRYYRISGQNVTSNIRSDIREINFFESNIRYFPNI